MKFRDIMSRIRQLDNQSSLWFIKHFYVLFFEAILVGAFLFFFANILNIINITADIQDNNIIERLLLAQNVSTLVILFLILLNSFWMLFMFSGMLRIRNVLRNIDFSLSRRKPSQEDN